MWTAAALGDILAAAWSDSDRMEMRRAVVLFIGVAAVFLLFLTVEVQAERLSPRTYDFESLSEDIAFADYYRAHARVRLLPERRLANGVSWRLLVDTRTGIRMPRITWMPNAASRVAANRYFDIIHGMAIADVDDVEKEWQPYFEDRRARREPIHIRTTDLVRQIDVALTYASRRFVSYREFAFVSRFENWTSVLNKGQVIDLVRGVGFGIEACPGMKRSYGEYEDYSWATPIMRQNPYPFDAPRHFVFGDLMRICEEPTYVAFRALVRRWAAHADNASVADHPEGPACGPWARALLRREYPVLPVLTPSGLALHRFRHVRVSVDEPDSPECHHGKSDTMPLIIPYRDLEPFMLPGPLKDELLK